MVAARGRGRGRRHRRRRRCRIARRDGGAGLVLAALFTVGLALQLQLGARLQSDGFYYFAYLRSLAFDRDVNFMNDYRMLGLGDKTYLFQPTTHRSRGIGVDDRAGDRLVAVLRRRARRRDAAAARRGSTSATDGTSFPYRQAVCVAGLFYGLLGCWFAYRLALLFFPATLAGAAVVPHRRRLVHGLVPREGAEHDARAVDGRGRGLHLAVGGDAGAADAARRGRCSGCSPDSWR